MNSDYIFGDDGFRGLYGEEQLSKEFLSCFAAALSIFMISHGIRKLNLAHDARGSAHEIIRTILGGLDASIKVEYYGCYTTPGLAFSTINDGSMGLMVTASHFPPEFNGVKLFKNGYKLKESEERELEVLIKRQLLNPTASLASTECLLRRVSKAKKASYLALLLGVFNSSRIDTGLLEIDCANGAGTMIANNLSKKINLSLFNNKPNGKNINQNCGAIDSPLISGSKPSAKYSILLDGDGDRLALVSNKFGLLESESLAAIYLYRHAPQGSRVVCSEVVNTGFITFCEKNNFELFLTPAGDRNVVEKTLQVDAVMGFEPSGHFFIPAFSTSMDGLLSGLLFTDSLLKQVPTSTELSIYTKLNRKIANYKIINGDENPKIWIQSLNKSLKEIALDGERIFARKSIWENVVRIYYDGDNFIKRIGEIKNILINSNKIHV